MVNLKGAKRDHAIMVLFKNDAAPLEVAAIKGEKFMDKYVCTLCGYEYDPALGDPDNGIAPGTPFEDLPEDWTCPLCGAAKSDFEKVE